MATTEGGPARASTRVKKASAAMAHLDAEGRREAAAARLEALEADNALVAAEESEEEYDIVAELDGAGPMGGVRKRAGKRATRGAIAGKRGPKPVSQLLEEANLEALPEGVPSYLRAAVGPPRTAAPRKWCTVCGFAAPSACPRCGMRVCSRRCGATHAETRCLRFVA